MAGCKYDLQLSDLIFLNNNFKNIFLDFEVHGSFNDIHILVYRLPALRCGLLGLLTLVERKLVLKQGSKAASIIEKKKKGDEAKTVDSWQKVFAFPVDNFKQIYIMELASALL